MYGGSEFESDKIEKQLACKYFLSVFWNFSVDFTINWFNDILHYLFSNPLMTAKQNLLQIHESKW